MWWPSAAPASGWADRPGSRASSRSSTPEWRKTTDDRSTRRNSRVKKAARARRRPRNDSGRDVTPRSVRIDLGDIRFWLCVQVASNDSTHHVCWTRLVYYHYIGPLYCDLYLRLVLGRASALRVDRATACGCSLAAYSWRTISPAFHWLCLLLWCCRYHDMFRLDLCCGWCRSLANCHRTSHTSRMCAGGEIFCVERTRTCLKGMFIIDLISHSEIHNNVPKTRPI